MKTPSLFQINCEKQLIYALEKAGSSLRKHETRIAREQYLYGEVIDKGIEIWIYEDEAMLSFNNKSYIFEKPDYPNEGSRIDAFVSAVIDCTQNKEPRDRGTARVTLFKGKII